MFLEIAILPIKPERAADIEQMGRDVAAYLQQGTTRGFHSFRLARAAEDPNRFVLHVTWDAIEDHKALGESEYGQHVGALIQECLAGESVVHHYTVVEGATLGDITF
jgi:heme-degrading monooxygenase HmoA